MTAAKLLIVNADDFGRTPGVNAGIVEAHRRGIVTSATLMVNQPAAAEAADLARQNPRLGVGLHVALTGGGAPTLPKAQVRSLVDPRGALWPTPEGLEAAHQHEVLLEVRAQVKRFRELVGRLPTHLDSHHHSHRLPAVLEALVTLAWETGLPVRSVSSDMRLRFLREGMATPDRFIDSFYGEDATLETLLQALAELQPGTTELMCHPARVDEALRSGSSYAERRAHELAILTHTEVRQNIQATGVRLASFELWANGPPTAPRPATSGGSPGSSS